MKTIEDYKNKIIQGDCLCVLQELPDDSVDAVITDPPYSSGGTHQSTRNQSTTTKYQLTGTKKKYFDFYHDNKDQRSFGYWCIFWLSECFRVTKPGGIVCVFTDWRQLPTTTDAVQSAGWLWQGIYAWDKTEAARPKKGYFRSQCEYVVWGSKGRLKSEGPCLPGVSRKSVVAKEKFHLTGKPVQVMRDIVKIAHREESIILDPFAGSGSTCVAAFQENKDFIGIELSPDYCAVARERIEVEKKQLTLMSI